MDNSDTLTIFSTYDTARRQTKHKKDSNKIGFFHFWFDQPIKPGYIFHKVANNVFIVFVIVLHKVGVINKKKYAPPLLYTI
jgi:hypothetical protein